MMSEPLLQIENLTIRFRTDEGEITAVEQAGFTIESGEIMGLVGESGSGKSVTAKSIMRLNADNTVYDRSSRILLNIDGEQIDVLSLRTERQLRRVRGDLVSMIFQEPMASFARR